MAWGVRMARTPSQLGSSMSACVASAKRSCVGIPCDVDGIAAAAELGQARFELLVGLRRELSEFAAEV